MRGGGGGGRGGGGGGEGKEEEIIEIPGFGVPKPPNPGI